MMVNQRTRASEPAHPSSKQQLAKYRAKRDFKLTTEPSGDSKKGQSKRHKLRFVIQKHAASRLHYDFRLEWEGVLKSWAVAKGPSYYPGDRRLAIEVEDHPLEYGGFEGIIPKGQYGAGTVLLWDRGSWEPVGDAREGFRNGNLKFVLDGEKLHGHWVLVRMAGKFAGQSKPSWLLIKERDGAQRGAEEVSITDQAPNSVLSGRDINAIAKAEDAVWNSRDGPSDDRGSSMRAKAYAANRRPAPPQASSLPNLSSRLAHLPKEALPSFIRPQLALMAKSPPNGEDWVHELKLDGYRIQARLEPGARTPVQLLTRTSLDWTYRLRPVAEAIGALPVASALFDGEVVVLAADGTTSFADLEAAFQEGARFSLT
jgi:bifunctional non-homologous end joining protein LigD